MYLFDLHCDTLTRLHDSAVLAPGESAFLTARETLPAGDALLHNSAMIALDRMAGEHWCQCFAIFMPDAYRGDAAIAYYESVYRYFRGQLAQNADRLAQVKDTAGADAAAAGGKAAAMLTVEGGSALAGDLARVGRLWECGVRMLTLTWNGANELGGGAVSGGGLTALGRKAVPLLEERGIVPDVSHLSDEGFWEVARLAKKPFCASHSNSRAVCNHPRNLTDDQFRFLVGSGGLVGLNYCVRFISEGRGDASYPQIARHIGHFLELGGEDTLAIGSDFDGADTPSWLCSVEQNRALYWLVCADFGRALADRLFWGNAARFFA